MEHVFSFIEKPPHLRDSDRISNTQRVNEPDHPWIVNRFFNQWFTMPQVHRSFQYDF